MTAADLEGDSALPTPDSGPVARISLSALRANARLLRSGALESSPLPADAWGHGVDEVADALRHGGTHGGAHGGTAPVSAPVPDDVATLLGLPGGHEEAVPALQLVGRVLSTKRLLAGEGVSYGLTFRAHRDTRVALVTGGYAQGVVRALGNRAEVDIAGRRHRIVGRVAMDVCVVDVGDVAVERGAEVTFLGDRTVGEPGVAEWADATGLRPLELVTAVGLHARREYTA